jgi:hypothetical protein
MQTRCCSLTRFAGGAPTAALTWRGHRNLQLCCCLPAQRNGRAYMRLDLTAAANNLAIQPNSQILQEFELMRGTYETFHRAVAVLQPARVLMLARIGYAARPDPAPRRPLDSLLLS